MSEPHASRRANRLASSSSPYLLQHAHNPVDWWPWGEEAFAEARRRNVPIFLSIGYATCYWCHVMERESFENESIAALMNERFVCIKVDREERPDIDDVYMTATQVMTGHGGWPMSVFLEPASLRPFWCGTYFPPVSRPGIGVPAFPHVLTNISEAFKAQHGEVVEQAGQIADIIRERMKPESGRGAIDGPGIVTEAISGLLRMFDRNHGGFGSAPKFPQPVFLELLLEARRSAGSEATSGAIDQAIRFTLDRMMIGGINDQLGGGFHRYSVDGHWTVPHFEKMLYDNALLARVYAQASVAFADPEYARTARETCEYVLRELTLPSGGFASGQDAEVDGKEGLNYLWTADEVQAVLGAADAEFALRLFGMESGPNFRDPHHPDEPARSVLRLTDRADRLASVLSPDAESFNASVKRIKSAMLQVRNKRKPPRLDDKALASWNGLMIGALAVVGRLLDESRFIAAATRAADFVLHHLVLPDGRLSRSRRGDSTSHPGFLEDYAFVAAGLIELATALQADEDRTRYIGEAMKLLATADRLFADDQGLMYDTEADPGFFVRARSLHDGALPCGTSVLLNTLIDLASLGDATALARLPRLYEGIGANLGELPLGLANGVRGVLRALSSAWARGTPLETQLRATAPPQDLADTAFTPVEVYASEERLSITTDTPASMKLVLQIAEGYHVLAADPWVDDPRGAIRGLVPLRVHVLGGSGIRVYADYPAGEPYEHAPAGIGRPRVYRGRVEFEVAVEVDGPNQGRPLLGVTFQACSDRACLHPRTAELDIAIDRA